MDNITAAAQHSDGPASDAQAPTPQAMPLVGSLGIWVVLAIVVFDQATKAMVRAWVPLHDDVEVIRGVLDLTYVRNSGAAFGLLNTIDFPFKSVVIAVIAAVALIAI